jgi:indolepyruvate ferredoxin oxidoreductase alpha subunit
LRRFAAEVDRVLVVEELDDFLEEHIRALGIRCEGKSHVPRIGELSPGVMRRVRNKLEGKPAAPMPAAPVKLDDLPGRPPVLCPGCPHRGVFHALGKLDVVVAGDIGCYSLAAFPPLNRLDTLVCMGAGVSMAHGMDRAGEPKKVVGVIGDSTFFHSGITGLLDIAYNRGAATIIVLDNRTTAMTGHQDHPGTGRTLMGGDAPVASIEDIGRACGIKNVATVDPYDLKETARVIRAAVQSDEAWLVVTRRPCPLHERITLGPPRRLDSEVCRECGLCLRLGCPALEGGQGAPEVNTLLCAGCGLCDQICPAEAIHITEAIHLG